MKARKRFLAVAFALATPSIAQAQTGTVSGTVTERATGRPLAGVQVAVEGTRLGQITNQAGRYMIQQVPAGRRQITAVFLGFIEGKQAVQVMAGQTASADFALQETVLPLQELVVSGSVSPTAGVKLPFTVSKVTTDQLQVPTTQTALASLQGKVAGANIIGGSGKPGSGVNILLRSPTGIESSNSPLIVVDGVVISRELDVTTQDIESMDIENIEVIKGAAAASLYGSRAASGVISITTNRGKSLPVGQTRVTSRTELGSNELFRATPQTTRHHFLMNSDRSRFVNAAGRDTTWLGRTATALRIQDQAYPGQIYDNLHALYNPGQYIKQSFSISQNTDNTTFLMSVTREDNSGALEGNDGFWRNLGRASIDHRIGQKLSVSFNAQHSRTRDDVVSGNPYETILIYPVFVNLKKKDATGEYVMLPDSTVEIENPFWRQRTRDHYDARSRTMASLNTRYAPLDFLTLDAQLSYDRADTKEQEYVPKGVPLSVTTDQPATGQLLLEHQENDAINGSVGAALSRRFRDLNSRLTLRSSFEREKSEWFYADGRDLLVKDVRDLNNASRIEDVASSTVDIRTNGLLADLSVDFKERYIGSLLMRRDGSSLFGPDERWQTYKRAAAKWRISQEPWFSLPHVNELGLRYAMGEAGGRPGFTAQYEAWNVNRVNGVTRETAGNRALKPQFTREQEFGLDLIAFNNRMSLELVYARHMSRDQIIIVPAAVITGFSSLRANAAVLKGHSYEATIQAYPIRRPNLTWSVNANGHTSVNRLVEWNRSCFFGSNFSREHEFTCAGERAGDFWVLQTVRRPDQLPVWLQSRASEFVVNDEGYLVWVGRDPATGQPRSFRDGIAKNLWGTSFSANGFTYRWGEPFRQVDPDGNLVRRNGGSSVPDLQFGFGTNFRYKNASAFAQFRGQIGGKVYNRARQWFYTQLRHADLDQSAKPDELKKPVDYYSRGLANSDTCNGSGADCGTYVDSFLEDGTNLRLGELAVRYRLTRNQLQKFVGRSAPSEIALGINGRNLFILTDYSGLDPERGSPLSRVEWVNYPLLRTWTATIDITF